MVENHRDARHWRISGDAKRNFYWKNNQFDNFKITFFPGFEKILTLGSEKEKSKNQFLQVEPHCPPLTDSVFDGIIGLRPFSLSLSLSLFSGLRPSRRAAGLRTDTTDRQTETDRQTDRQTDRTGRQTDRQTEIQTDRETDRDRQTGRQRDRQTDKQTERQKERQTDRQTDRQTGRQTDIQTYRHTDIMLGRKKDIAQSSTNI